MARQRRGVERARGSARALRPIRIVSTCTHRGQYIEPMLAHAVALLPSQCEVCRGWGAGLLCRHCRAQHAPVRPRCARCGLALGAAAAGCGACQRDPPPYERTVCALDYAFPWDHLIAAFKFHGRVDLALPLAALLCEAIEREGVPPCLVVPVPLAHARLAERGYNQAWELARRIARRLALQALPDALQRVLDTPSQATRASSAERGRNLRNAFAPAPGAPASGAHVALVDDVMTTGATAREAAAALLRGGAHSVQLWVLARTPAPA